MRINNSVHGLLSPVLWSSLILFLLTGCGKHETAALKNGLGGKKLGGVYTLNEIRGNPSSLDPVRMNSKVEDDIGSNIFDKLVQNNSALDLVPDLAKSWEISSDGKTYTFHLRTDVFFHDDPSFAGGKGRKMTAKDVKYSFERVCDTKTLTSGFWVFEDIVEGANDYFKAPSASGVSGFVVQDDSTFIVHLTKSFAPFLEHLTTSFGYIVPREAVEHYGKDFFQHPVGTGAFRFVSWQPDEEILLERNPNYWEYDSAGNRLPLLDEVKFTLIKDDKTLLQSFQQRNEDEDFTLPTESFPEIVTADKQLTSQYSKYVLQYVSAMNSYFMEYLCSKPPFNNMALRRAMSFAVDRESIVKYVLKGAPHGIADHGIIPPAFSHYPIEDVHGITYNLDSTKHWLEVAGFPEGHGAPAITLSVYNEPRPMQIAEAVQRMWQNIGLTVNLQVMQSGALLDGSEDGTLQLWLTRWYADYPEPENFLNLVDGELVPKDPAMKSYPNSARWNNDRFNALFTQAIATTDESKRMELYAQAENIAAFEA
ncbi:MAG TPA: ABC transporter substrate-binding protein, partial [Candidatus Kapabacteria bacterium]